MNTTDYILLAVLAGGAIFVSYRLFLGFRIARSSELKQVKSADYSEPPRAESAMADFER